MKVLIQAFTLHIKTTLFYLIYLFVFWDHSGKELREIADDGDVYCHAYVDKFPIVEWSPLCEKK